jgi:subtilase family protein
MLRKAPQRDSTGRFGFKLLLLIFPMVFIGNLTAQDPTLSPPSSFPAGLHHKIQTSDSDLGNRILAQGGRVLADYGGFKLYEIEQPGADVLNHPGAQLRDEFDFVSLAAKRIDTRQPEAVQARQTAGAFSGKRLHLIQFAGPPLPEWVDAIAKTGVRLVSYIPHNAYLVYGDAKSVGQLQTLAGTAAFVQWDGQYLDDYKIHPKARATDAKGNPRQIGTTVFAIQLVADAVANPATLALIDQLKLAPVRREFDILNYRNLVVPLPADRLKDIAAQPDVISIQPYFEPHKLDERQDQILADNLTGNVPTGPGYLAWLAGKGFTQAQFDAPGGPVVDVSDSGIDDGTTAPHHFGLYQLGNLTNASRVIYSRLEGTPNAGSTLQGCDGHGTLNAHIIGGYDDWTNIFSHLDSVGFSYELGVCPFVKLGSSVIFDPDNFTGPDYPTLETDAYASGARISNNSWGDSGGADYNSDSQAYDALVRDAGGSGNSRPMVIVFAAGNGGPSSQSITAPGTAKNVITVGAADNVRSLSTANGGNSSAGNDGSNIPDTQANSANDMLAFSGRGPCTDGRMKPDLVAPGSHVTGGAPQNGPPPAPTSTGSGLPCFNGNGVTGLPGSGNLNDPDNFFPLGQQFFTVSSGTSHSTPAVSGACALVWQYFVNNGFEPANAPPSPAMIKAYLMNSARYMTGTNANDTLWSPSQGMGELNLGTAFDGTARILRDQLGADKFTATGQRRTFTGTVSDPTKPFRATLAWTDAPGSTTANSALVNDLDLAVIIGGRTYKGNVFSGDHSVTGGSADSNNNVESVFLPAGVSKNFAVIITAANIAADGTTDGGSVPEQDFALVIYNATEAAVPVITENGYVLVSESCAPTNDAVDPGETVIVNFAMQNVGTADTTANLSATLLATNGIVAPSGPQTYGVLTAGGPAASESFMFTADGSCGAAISPTFQLQDEGTNLNTVIFNVPLGTRSPTFVQNFDGVTAPALPPGWTTTSSGAQSKWVTSGSLSDTPPNAAFSPDPPNVGVNALVSPVIILPLGLAQLTFQNDYNLEDGFDGGVLEIKIGSGSFTDILAAGGSFVSGGYTSTISSSFSNPLAGRQGWSGSSGGFITTTVNLPSAAAGKAIQLQWRCGTDKGNGGSSYAGWYVDSVAVSGYVCCGVTNQPYFPSAGSYSGLFYQPSGVQFPTSGAFTAKTTKTGGYSGALQMGASRYSFSGQFNALGFDTRTVTRNNSTPLTLFLQMDVTDNSRVTGTVSNATWTASLTAFRATFNSKTNPPPQMGKYTWLIPGRADASAQPGGDSFGTVAVDGSGNVTLAGTLGDGSKLSEKTILSAQGRWPLYASLYSGNGMVLGWLGFTNELTNDIDGLVTWIKPGQPASKLYPGGFTNQTEAIGSLYLFTNTVPVLNFSTGQVSLVNGNMAAGITNQVVLGANNKVTDTNKLSLTITTTSGLFKGNVVNPATGKAISFNGVLLQKQDFGSGSFLGTNQTGRVFFGR